VAVTINRISCIIVIFAYLLIFSSLENTIIAYDSKDYLEFAKLIGDGNFFQNLSSHRDSFALTIRTPIYPLLIWIGDFLKADNHLGVIFLHWMLGLIAVGSLMIALRNEVSPLISGAGGILALYRYRDYFPTILSEWICLCQIMIISALIFSLQKFPRFRILQIGWVVSILVLTRPALIAFLLLPMVLGVGLRKVSVIGRISIVAISLIPFVSWVLLNCIRLGSLTISPAGGYSTFAALSPIVYLSESEISSLDSREFARLFAPLRIPEDKRVIPLALTYSDDPAYIGAVCTNLKSVTEAVRVKLGWNYVRLGNALRAYALDVIKSHPRHYFQFVLGGVERVFEHFWFLLLFAVASGYSVYRAKLEKLRLISQGMFAFHFLHVLTVAAGGAVLDRYLELTYCGFIAVGAPFVFKAAQEASAAIGSFDLRIGKTGKEQA